MQFGGQRTDEKLRPVGQPHNIYIKLAEDVLPDPDALLVTSISPQKTLTDGMTEAEFLRLFYKEIATPDTTFVGYNTVRFDDEFMRYLQYRNFYDAYEWQWSEGRSRWDLLDVVRMTRALRPDGIKWPFDSEGKPSNRLELLTAVNKISHDGAHDALSDVLATIEVARLIQKNQPKLFTFLLSIRGKKAVAEVADSGEPFVYTSGKYPSEFEKTTVVAKLMNHPNRQGALVYDLRHDPTLFQNMTPAQLAEAWTWKKDRDESKDPRLPVKNLLYNRCPAVAPLGVLDEASRERIKLDIKTINENYKKVVSIKPAFTKKLAEALKILDTRQQERLFTEPHDVDTQLYDGFIGDYDKKLFPAVHSTKPNELRVDTFTFHDKRLATLLPLYKARNYPGSLTQEERQVWETYCQNKLLAGGKDSALAKYLQRIEELPGQRKLTKAQQLLLEDLRLYGEQLIPAETA